MDEFRTALVAKESQYAPALPSHISPERFQGTVVTAVNLNPDLLKADRRSLFNACTRAAHDGLMPDGREGALVIFGKQVTWMPMVYGIIKKARQSGEIATLGARIVYQNELDTGRFKFTIRDGEDVLEHDPILFGERGVPVGAYARVKFKDGSIEYEILNKAELDKIRNVSRAKNGGPWVEWWEEMAKKSAIRRLAKRLPLSSELQATISHGEEVTEYQEIKQAERTRLIDAARQLGSSADEMVDDEPADAGEHGSDGGDAEPSNQSNPLADLDAELLALADCISTQAVDRLEKEVGAALVGEPAKLEAWANACAEKATALMEKGRKPK